MLSHFPTRIPMRNVTGVKDDHIKVKMRRNTDVFSTRMQLWNITDVKQGRVHFGHDPRFAFYERLLFGQLRDVRTLLYTASPEEIKAAATRGDVEIRIFSFLFPLPSSPAPDAQNHFPHLQALGGAGALKSHEKLNTGSDLI